MLFSEKNNEIQLHIVYLFVLQLLIIKTLLSELVKLCKITVEVRGSAIVGNDLSFLFP